MATLIIAEKNKAAMAIAEALGTVSVIKKQKLNVYSVPSKNIFVIPLRGHIMEYRNSEEYKSWEKSNSREIITNPKAIEKVPIKNSYPYINTIKEYSKVCSECIIGTDADIEGCNIGLFDALPFVKQVNHDIIVSQIWLSSLQKDEIIRKFSNRISPKWSWGESGEARAIIDAIIGFSATREVTNTLKPLLINLNRKFVSIGRVQTCLLYLIYLLEEKIKNFVPEAYFTIEAILFTDDNKIKANHKSNPFKKEEETKAKSIYQKIKDEKIAFIKNNTNSKVSKKPPTPLNTSKALILLTKNLKITANQALSTMNELYLNKIISYPRTESDVYKADFDHLQYLKKFISHSQYGIYIQNILKENRIIPTKGKKDAGDHPPITPLESLELDDTKFKTDLQKKVYNILARYYLALFGNEATELHSKLDILIKDEPFTARSSTLISEGFYQIVPFLKPQYDKKIVVNGNTIPIEKILINSKQTKPPPRYTDPSLLKLMEDNNLGTKSTRPIIIQLLIKRDLINRNNYSYFITELGRFLIENLKPIWLSFLEPNFTKIVEGKLENIKEQKDNLNRVVNNIKETFLDLYDKFLITKEKFKSKINDFAKKNVSLFQNKVEGKKDRITTSMCPSCKTHPMKLIHTKNKSRCLICTNEKCEKKFLSVPKKGKVFILNSNCNNCGFNIFKISAKKDSKYFNYYICPNCWSDGLKNRSGKGFCSNCNSHKINNEKCVKK